MHSSALPHWVEWRRPFSHSSSSAEAAGDNSGYFVIAEIVSSKEKADQLRALLVPFSEMSAKEPGCLKYVLMEVIAEPGRFLTYERWTNKAALDAHMVTKEIKEILPEARAHPGQAGQLRYSSMVASACKPDPVKHLQRSPCAATPAG